MLYQVVKHLRAPRETLQGALLTVLDKKATTAYVKAKEQLLLKNGLLYRKTNIGPAKETIFQFVVPQRHRSAAMDGCHREAAHQGQCRSASLMQERFWWPGKAGTSVIVSENAAVAASSKQLRRLHPCSL